MGNYILSGLRFFFTPILILMAIIGILVCILEDLISFMFKLVWNKMRHKLFNADINKTNKLPTPQVEGINYSRRYVSEFFAASSEEFTQKKLTFMKSDVENTEYYND